MKKIISLFVRDHQGDPRRVLNQVTPGAEWVQAGEGVATEKIDGTSCMIRDGKLYRRYDAKNGKTPPENFEPAQEPDPITGHWPGWIPVGDSPQDQWHREAWLLDMDAKDGTYELVGPKVQGNPYCYEYHHLLLHGDNRLFNVPTDFVWLLNYLELYPIEGIVWHHPDGRMVKIKARDFGIEWPRKKQEAA